jgi:hypothetical protein
MSKGTHTPGPWTNHKWNCQEHQISAQGGTIALVSHSHALVPEAEADANARLIAAAPSMHAVGYKLAACAARVVERWSGGDLAEAVRNLDRARQEWVAVAERVRGK